MSISKYSLFPIFILSLSMFGTMASAGTPDGMTPAAEPVCDILQSGTPGLYGLCVAYCEAQDLDVNKKNKSAPNRRILANYRKKMQPGDYDMPCLKTPCPCWAEEELLSVDNSNIIINESCKNITPPEWRLTANAGLVPVGGSHKFVVSKLNKNWYCAKYTGKLKETFYITEQEAKQCGAVQIGNRCEELGY